MGKQDNLISSALAHDDRAVFDRLFEMLYPKVKYFVLSMCHDEDEAENLTQDIFLKLWTKRERLRDIDNLDAYVFTVAHHEALNFIRHSLVLTTTPIDTTAKSQADSDDTERDMEYRQLLDMVYAEISRMPEKRRRIFMMSREDGLSNQEIADRLGISRRTVEAHISAALRDLRRVSYVLFLLSLWNN